MRSLLPAIIDIYDMPYSAPRGAGSGGSGAAHLDFAVMRDGGLPVSGGRDSHLPDAVFVHVSNFTSVAVDAKGLA